MSEKAGAMRIPNADEVGRALPMAEAIAAMKEAYGALARGTAIVPLRASLRIPPHDGTTLVMPAYVGGGGEALAVKVVSLFPHNRARGLPLIHAAVAVFAPDTGRLLALLEGGTLTAIRTGAASGAATDLLARPDARRVAILGSGVQARTQLAAICTVRPVAEVRVYSPDAARLAAFVAAVAGRAPVPANVRAAASAAEAISGADVVCAATTSTTPVFADADVAAGTHINAIGSFQPHVQEIPDATIARARLVVDQREAALDETGDLIQPIRRGVIAAGHIAAELGEVVLERARGRENDRQVTLFKSVGLAVQDAVAARVALANAERDGLGTEVEW